MDDVENAPEDFPREPALGSISGVQPKLLVIKVDGEFRSDVNEGEIYRRWLVCEDLVQQLTLKTTKRMREGRIPSVDDYVNKLQKWLEAQEWEGWKVTGPEAKWMRDRIKALVEVETGPK